MEDGSKNVLAARWIPARSKQQEAVGDNDVADVHPSLSTGAGAKEAEARDKMLDEVADLKAKCEMLLLREAMLRASNIFDRLRV